MAVLGDIDDLQPRMWLKSLRQGILTAKMVVWIRDGGKGFWRLFGECFAKYAIGILDFYHASQNLWKGIQKWLDGRTQRAKRWFEWGRPLMKLGKIRGILENLAMVLLLDKLASWEEKEYSMGPVKSWRKYSITGVTQHLRSLENQ